MLLSAPNVNTVISDISSTNLTASQLRIWTGQKLNPEVPLYNMALAFHIHGNLDNKAFRDAFLMLIKQSDALRTVIEENHGVPLQGCKEKIQFVFELINLSDHQHPEKLAQSWMQERVSKPFDLQERLFDSALLKTRDAEYIWYLNQHHLITDGLSCEIIFKRMAEFYKLAQAGSLNKAKEQPTFNAYYEYEQKNRNSKAYNNASSYWQENTAQMPGTLDLYGQPTAIQSLNTKREFVDIGKNRSEILRNLTKEDGIRSFSKDLSLFYIFAALLFAYLHRISGSNNVVIGTTNHNRSTAAFKKTIGVFIELFPLRTVIDPQETFRGLIKKIIPEIHNYLKNAQPGVSSEIPSNIFSVVLNYINASFPDFLGIPVESFWIHPGYGDKGHALRVQIHDLDQSGNFHLLFDFNKEIFNKNLRENAIGHYLRLMDALLENPDQRIDSISLLSNTEFKALITSYNNTSTALPVGNHNFLKLFKEQVAVAPDAAAVNDGGQLTSFKQLDQSSDRIAGYLQNKGLNKEEMVGVFMERSTELIITLVAILKAGGAFVPIDSSFPKKRLAYILQDCKAPFVLTQKNLEDQLPQGEAEIISFENMIDLTIDNLPVSYFTKTACSNLAYVIYTSGSTGQPKGVMVQHDSLANYLFWARNKYMADGPHDFPLFSSIAADLTITSLLLPLISGSMIVIYRETKDGVDLSIINVFTDDAVDIIKLTPSHLALMEHSNAPINRLKKLIVGGEDFKAALANRVSSFFPNKIEIFNEYGPTEATVGCMIYQFDPDHDRKSVAIGKPIDNMRIYLLDVAMNPVPVGVKGDIYIAGKGLAKGYFNKDDMTAEKFVNDPFYPGEKIYRSGDVGCWRSERIIEYFGRIDDQVKVRGFRIEQGEIEAALLQFPGIKESSVKVLDNQSDILSGPIYYCNKCGLESNHPQAALDSEGVCSVCRTFEPQQEVARQYFRTKKDLHPILDDARKRSTGRYDCLLQYSGGKDSTYALYQLVAMGMTPFVFSIDNGYISENAKKNINRVVQDLNLDFEWGQTPAMNEIFVDSLRRFSNVCNGCQKAINTMSINLALEKGIKYIFTGLSRGQSFETRVSELFSNDIFDSDEIDRTIIEARKAYHRMDDAVSRNLDMSAFQDDSVFEEVQFIDFYRYCDVELHEVMNFLDQKTPWTRPADTGRSTNCLINEAGIFIHKKERGYHNYSLPYSWDVRLGHKERDSALAELDDGINEIRVHRMLREIGYDPDEKTYLKVDRRIAAYYVAEQEYSSEDLRLFLSNILPSYMIPVYFHRMDYFPLNPTGKVDREALPLPDTFLSRSKNQYTSPRNETEKKLSEIWAKVLGLEQVGVHDNFFDLGGDSIQNIQIVSRAAKIGLNFTPGLLFQHQTIAELGLHINTDPFESSDLRQYEGRIPLTPIQHWFFDQNIPRPHIWNMTLKTDVKKKIAPSVLEGALQSLINHHDSLRLCFVHSRSGWEQFEREPDNSFQLEYFNLSEQPPKGQDQEINRIIQEAHYSLDLQKGHLVKAIYFERSNEEFGLLAIIIHHLAVDGVSWYIIMEDLGLAINQITAGKSVMFPRKTASFKEWSDKLYNYTNTSISESEYSYWNNQKWSRSVPLPRDSGLPGFGKESSSETMIVKLEEEFTDNLLQKATLSGRVAVDELILAALLETLCNWSGSSSIRLDKEGHGREGVIDDVAIFRTLGWFTTLFPLNLTLTESKEANQIIEEVKEQVRSIPNRGLGFGLLYYLKENKKIRDSLKEIPKAEVLFNYMGTIHQMVGDSSLFQLKDQLPATRDSQGERPYLIEINAFVIDSQLEVYWTYSRDRHQPDTIQKISTNFLQTLRDLINQCVKLPIAENAGTNFSSSLSEVEKIQQEYEAEDVYPLSSLQAGMLFHSLKDPETGVYVVQYSCKLTGSFNHQLFKSSWQKVVQRHQALRAAFLWEELDEPIQVIHQKVELDWQIEILDESQKRKWNQLLKTFLQEDRLRGFKTDRAPLMRFRLFRIGENKHHFIWSFHHILCDGWSTVIILKEVFEIYQLLCRGELYNEYTTHFHRDYFAWLKKQDITRAESFWKKQLQDHSGPTSLTIRQVQRADQGNLRKELLFSNQLTAELKTVAQKKRLTLNTLIQGVWAILLHRYSSEKDILFGATVSGRPISLEGIETMVGLFMNTLPVRVQIKPEQSLSSWLVDLQNNQIEARSYEYSPLVKIQEWCGLPAGQALFESIVVFENVPVDDSFEKSIAEIEISEVSFLDQSNYPFALLVVPGDSMRLIAVYDSHCFTATSVSKLLNHLHILLQSFAGQPDQVIKDLPILTEQEHQLIRTWRGSAIRELPEFPVYRMVEAQADLNPDMDAVVYGGMRLSYSELNARANQLAHHLCRQSAGNGKFVGIYIDRSVEMIIAILAILKSGAIYVPLDPSYPDDRLIYMMNDSGIKLVLTQKKLENKLTDTGPKVIAIDNDDNGISQYKTTNLQKKSNPEDLAYLIYTSGSTGRPKGVMINHGNLIHATVARESYYKNSPKRFLLLSSISFDSSVAGIFGTLCRGGCLYVPDQKHFRDVNYLSDLISKYSITHVLCVPSLYQQMLQYHQAALGSLKSLILAGEPCLPDLVDKHKMLFPNTELFNEYGPTEASVWSTVFDCQQNYSAMTVPIGKPIVNMQVFILDKDLRPVPIGIPGELYLSGAGISPGYLNKQEMTAERFINNPFSDNQDEKLYKTGDMVRFLNDGNLEFLGRCDEQIKMRGYRIEPGEIEAELLLLDYVEQAAVVPSAFPVSIKQWQSPSDNINAEEPEELAKYLADMEPDLAETILSEIENETFEDEEESDFVDRVPETFKGDEILEKWSQDHPQFNLGLAVKSRNFIAPPRKNQREWLVRQALNEFESDLEHLDKVSKYFVTGQDIELKAFDMSQSTLDDDQIMEDWQIPIMKAMAKYACEGKGDLLEIGFGRGVSAGFIQEFGVRTHTIIESNKKIIKQFYGPWKGKYPNQNIRLVPGRWQDVLDQLGTYDAVFFHAFPLNEEEFIEYILNSITFAEHFFSTAAELLKPNGVFTYLTTEIDSLSRRHQRALFQYFSSITMEVQKLSVPNDTKDAWWADSMVIVKAVK